MAHGSQSSLACMNELALGCFSEIAWSWKINPLVLNFHIEGRVTHVAMNRRVRNGLAGQARACMHLIATAMTEFWGERGGGRTRFMDSPVVGQCQFSLASFCK